MATSEYEIIRDQQERDNLQRSIASAETALAVSAPSTRRILENLIEGARGRIATLDTKIKDEREAEVREQAAIALMAQKEAALTAREQAEYSGFLKEDFFTKRDFGRLEHFYAHAWDRLSEEGKDEMSKRIDEGIKRHEFRFDELPKVVQEKEAEHRAAKAEREPPTNTQLGKKETNVPSAAKPPESSAMQDIDLGSVSLKGAILVDSPSHASAASLPNASGSQALSR